MNNIKTLLIFFFWKPANTITVVKSIFLLSDLNAGYHCEIIIVRGRPMLVAVVGSHCQRIYIPKNVYKAFD